MSVNTQRALDDYENRLEGESVSAAERESLIEELRSVIRRYEEIEAETSELVTEVAGDDGALTVRSLGENSTAVNEWARDNAETAAEVERLKDDLKRLLLPARWNVDEDFGLLGGPDPVETFGEGLSDVCRGILLPYVVIDYCS